MSTKNAHTGDFAKLYAGEQSRLFAFIYSLVGSQDLAKDVLQETNVVLWEKREEFELGTNFTAWAFRIARYQVMAMREKQSRDRLVFSDAFLDLIADEAERFDEQFEQRQAALERCLEAMPENSAELLRQRYMRGETVTSIASQLNRRANSISVQLHRLRLALSRCVEGRLGLSPRGGR